MDSSVPSPALGPTLVHYQAHVLRNVRTHNAHESRVQRLSCAVGRSPEQFVIGFEENNERHSCELLGI